MVKKLLWLIIFCSSVYAIDVQPDKNTFKKNIATLKEEALQLGISCKVVDQVFPAITFKKEIINKDSSQPASLESTEHYLSQRVRPSRIKFGRKFLHTNAAHFIPICHKFGVDFELLIALWAVETDFGTNMGKFHSFSGMATLMCTRRYDFFKKEFLTLLQLVNKDVVRLENLEGEWAGAHGHFQFMPTTIAKYGIDYDKDGVIDLKGSLDDAFASAANYMRALGWKYGMPWGYEVALEHELPEGLISISSRHLKAKKRLQEWFDLGVIPFNAETVNYAELSAWLILADGKVNKYYVVFDNFKAILRWNNSFKYGLMVGLLMEQIKS